MVVTVAVTASIAGCAGHTDQVTPVRTGVSPPTSSVIPPTATTSRPPPRPPTAAARLSGFLAGAAQLDRRLRAVATLINGDIEARTVAFRRTTVAAIRSIEPASLAASIPGGMPPDLQAKVYLVFSELVSRRYAFQPIVLAPARPIARDSSTAREVFQGLANGSVPAARFPADLAALRSLSAAEGPIASVSPDSRAAAEVAVQVAYIVGRNSGCAGSGGWWETSPAPVRWTPGAVFGSHHVTGTVVGVRFDARYRATAGWLVLFNAC